MCLTCEIFWEGTGGGFLSPGHYTSDGSASRLLHSQFSPEMISLFHHVPCLSETHGSEVGQRNGDRYIAAPQEELLQTKPLIRLLDYMLPGSRESVIGRSNRPFVFFAV